MKYTSPIIGEGSGSMGGTTYSHNRYGQYMRNRRVPVNPNTALQDAVRTVFADLAQRWNSTLLTAQRSAWNNYAANVAVKDKLGQDIYLTGLNHYLRSNCALIQGGLTRVDDGPVIFTLPDTDPAFVVTASEETQLLSIAFNEDLDWCDEDGAAMLVSSGIPVNPTVNFFGGPFRFADAIEGDSVAPPTTPQTMTSPWQIAVDQRVYSRARIVLADGRLSNFFGSNFLCAA
jgi:hypothetical protein